MVKFYSDEENDNMCSEYRPIPFKLRNLTTGIVAKPTNNMTNARTRLFRGPVPQSINAATKSSLYSGKLPKSAVIPFYKELYKEVMIEDQKVPTRAELNEEAIVNMMRDATEPRMIPGQKKTILLQDKSEMSSKVRDAQRLRRDRDKMSDADINVDNKVDFMRAEQQRKADRLEANRLNKLSRQDNEKLSVDTEGDVKRVLKEVPKPDARVGRRKLY
tara:strand:- start:4235 stop:4885 length:651 start_codon:yes stop_codon:yes gene_type:complete